MARFSRRWPGRVIGPQRQSLAVPQGGAPTPRLIEPQVTSLVDEISARRRIQSRIVTSRWPGYQWVGLPPVTPLIEPQVVSPARPVDQRAHVHGSVIALRSQALSGPILGGHVIQVSLVDEAAPRRYRRGGVYGIRWAGYAWVGLPPVTRLIQPTVQSPVDETAPRRHPGAVLSPRSAAYAASAAPPSQPRLIQPLLVAARAVRQQRHGDVITLRTVVAPVTPPRPVVVGQAVARRAEAPRLRGAVCQPRTRTAPVSPPRPLIVGSALPTQRRRRKTSVLISHGRFQPQAGSQPVFRSLVGYPAGTPDKAVPLTGDYAHPPGGYAAGVKSGDSAQPPGSGSGTVNL